MFSRTEPPTYVLILARLFGRSYSYAAPLQLPTNLKEGSKWSDKCTCVSNSQVLTKKQINPQLSKKHLIRINIRLKSDKDKITKEYLESVKQIMLAKLQIRTL